MRLRMLSILMPVSMASGIGSLATLTSAAKRELA